MDSAELGTSEVHNNLVPQGQEFMESYHVVLKVGLTKKDPNTLNSGFQSTKRWEQTCLSDLLLVSETCSTSLTIKLSVRIGSAVFTFCQQQIDLSGNNSWKIHTTNLL